jgi:hypothetical protein
LSAFMEWANRSGHFAYYQALLNTYWVNNNLKAGISRSWKGMYAPYKKLIERLAKILISDHYISVCKLGIFFLQWINVENPFVIQSCDIRLHLLWASDILIKKSIHILQSLDCAWIYIYVYIYIYV